MEKTFEELKAGAETIKTNVLPESNTAQLVGGEFLNVIGKIEETERKKADKTSLDQEISRATEVEIQLSDRIASKASQSDLDVEQKKRSNDDQALSERIDVHTAQLGSLAAIVEQSDQESNEKIVELQVDTSQIKKQLSDEVSRATTSEQQLSGEIALKVDQTDFDGERTVRYEEDLALQQALEKETQRAEKAETQLASKASSTETEILSHDRRLQTVSMQISEEIERAVNAERNLALLIGAKADRENTYTKKEVNDLIKHVITENGEHYILIDLKVPDSELFEILSIYIGSRFVAIKDEKTFNLQISWESTEKVELSFFEDLKHEFIILNKNLNDSSVLREEYYVKYSF